MKVFEVNEDGSLVELPDMQLAPESVIIVVDEEDKRMWLWKGQSCQIRKKFIGSRALADLRKKEYGFAYIPQTCDQGEETAEFVAMLQKIGKEDLVSAEVLKKAKELMERQSRINVFDETEEEPHKLTASISDEEVARIKDRPGQVPTSQLPSKIAKMGAPGNRPTPSILSALDSLEEEKEGEIKAPIPKMTKEETKTVERATREAIKENKEDLLKKSFDILKDLGVPKGFYRDLIIIGTSVYTESYDGSFEELDEPPEGVFFSRSHVPRMICENGIVRAIEFLKPEEGAELSEEDEKIAQDIEDILSMFEIDIG